MVADSHGLLDCAKAVILVTKEKFTAGIWDPFQEMHWFDLIVEKDITLPPKGLIECSERLYLVPIISRQDVLVFCAPFVVVLFLQIDLDVFNVWERDPQADDRAGVVVGEVESLADFAHVWSLSH